MSDPFAELKAAHKAGHTIECPSYRIKYNIPEEYKSIKFRLYLTTANIVRVVNQGSAIAMTYTECEQSVPDFKCWLGDEICLGDL